MAKGVLGPAAGAAAFTLAVTALLMSAACHPVLEEDPAQLPKAGVTVNLEWKDGPALAQPRAYHDVVTLDDGRMLVIGGLTATGPTASTEVFDPESQTWTPGPNMLSKRVGHTATLLRDGTVLVAGGDTGTGATASAELIDIPGDFAVPLPDMSFARTGHSSAVLSSGKVLVTGGTDWRSGVWAQAELFDPSDRSWSAAGTMNRARLFACAEALEDGTALLIGGDADGTSEVFDPGTNTWGALAGMSSKRSRASSSLLADGRVLVAGGLSGDEPLRSSEVFSMSSNNWAPAGDMSIPRASFCLARLPNGWLLASGSLSKLGTTGSCDLFTPASSTWSAGEPMRVPRGAHGCAVDPGGSAYVFGGMTGGVLTPSVEVFAEEASPEPGYCQPIDLLPLVLAAEEVPGSSELGMVAKLYAAQAKYDTGDFETCANIMDAFYNQVRAFAENGHMTKEHAVAIYDAYASVVTCIGGTPLPPSENMVP